MFWFHAEYHCMFIFLFICIGHMHFQNLDPFTLFIFKIPLKPKCFMCFGEESTSWKSPLYQILPLCEIIFWSRHQI